MAQFIKLLPEYKHSWKSLVRLILTTAVLIALWVTLKKNEQSLSDVWTIVRSKWEVGNTGWLFAMLVLVPVNWALESKKWQMLVSKVMPIPFGEAVKSTLTGLMTGLAMPAQVGEIVGRVGALNIAGRMRTVGAAFISGGIQFYAAVFVGTGAFFYAESHLMLSPLGYGVLVGLFGAIVLFGLMLFVLRRRLALITPGSGWKERIRSSVEIISIYSNSELLAAFGVGMVRYITYTAQFIAALLFFELPLSPAYMTACAALVLLVKTLLPALNLLGDLGVRGITAVFIFAKFGIQADSAVAVTLLVWATNILLPSLVGLLWLWWGAQHSKHVA